MAQKQRIMERRSAHAVNRVCTFGAGTMATDASVDDEPVMMVRMRRSPHMIGMGYLKVLNSVMATDERRFLHNFNHDGIVRRIIWLFPVSYVRKLVTELSGGVFGYLDSVLERHSFDEFGELI